jgi:hypothetical protein
VIRHGVIGAKVLPSLLAPRFGFSSDAADAYARIVGGHHGAFPTLYEIGALEIGEDAVGSDEWDEARRDLIDLIAGRFKIDSTTAPRVPRGPDAIALAGLVSVADWIGSMREYFGFAVRDGAAVFPFRTGFPLVTPPPSVCPFPSLVSVFLSLSRSPVSVSMLRRGFEDLSDRK